MNYMSTYCQVFRVFNSNINVSLLKCKNAEFACCDWKVVCCRRQVWSLGSWCGTRKLPMKSSLCALTDPIWREIRFTASAAPAQEDVTRTREISPDIAPELCWDFCDDAANFGCQVWPVRAKSVKVLWIFKVVERSQLDILILPKDIQSLFTLM